jgi:heme/copper-type cytochrome/quinol oxidase subunit 2
MEWIGDQILADMTYLKTTITELNRKTKNLVIITKIMVFVLGIILLMVIATAWRILR